jgi:hypothetical protein
MIPPGWAASPEPISLSLRDCGKPDGLSVTVEWPAGAPVPRAGDSVSINGSDLYTVRYVQWWLDDPEHAETGRPRLVVQLVA